MQHQQGGAQYGGAPPQPELAPFPSSANPRPQFPGIPTGHPEAAAPISSRPPPAAQNFGELAVAATGSFHDEDALAAGEDAERGGTPGNRWPREETLALLKIRSEMDAEFRDASLKGPLWENVSRKLGELGYIRSAKKCKEKFENVHKYYKRTKEGRAGRQDGKSYRFFSQLEALHTSPGGLTIGSGSGSNTPISMSNPIPALPAPVAAAATPIWANIQPQQPPPVTAPTPTPFVPPPAATHATQGTMPSSGAGAATGISLSSDTFTSSSYDSDDDEDTEEGGGGPSTEGRKRKRGSGSASGGPTGSRKMMAFFEGLMMQVMEKQEAMQQRFLETIEKREQERMVKEDAWRRQEMARLNREHELLAQERAVAASRDSALIQFLQKIGGQPMQVPPPPPAAAVIPAAPPPRPVVIPIPVTPPPRPVAAPAVPPPPQQESPKELPPPPPQPQHQQHPPQQKIPPQQPPPQQPPPPHELHHAHQTSETVVVRNLPSSSCTELVPVPEQQELALAATPRGAFEPGVTPSRWPKSEVHALIKLRSGLEPRYQEAGPKGPLWEEISLGMQRLGYNRSSKRCKEKWENINKYFKKVKESNKKRPEDAKTCPYFHQLDALYRKKNPPSTSNAGYSIESNPQALAQAPPLLPPQPVQEPVPLQIQHETERKNGDDNTGNQGGIQIQTSNGGLPPSFFEGGSSGGATMNKPEDIMKELMEQQHRRQATMNHYSKLEESRNDHNMYDDEDDDDEDDEEDDDGKMVYKMQFERQNVGSGSGSGGGAASTKAAAATTAGSFLGMVQ